MPDRSSLSSASALPASETNHEEHAQHSANRLLENPIWAALSTEHAPLALVHGNARRYPTEIGPLSGIPDHSAENFEALRVLAGPAGVVVLFCIEQPRIPAGWTLLRGGSIDQMICTGAARDANKPLDGDATLRVLTPADAPEMVALAELTEPGPFRLRTIELGTFFGIFHGDRLMAMAGKRLHLPGYVEVSGVCTHPDARGRGYAPLLMSRVMEEIASDGKIPFLHTFADNTPAIRVYEGLGYTRSRSFHLAVLRNEQ